MTVIRTFSKRRDLRQERRFLSQGTLRLLNQRQRLKRLRAAGLDIRAAARMLEILEDSQLAILANVTRHERES